MPRSKIRLFPDNVLRKSCSPVRNFNPELKKLLKDLFAIMKSQKHGIGIAAPQIGVSKQVAVVDVSARTKTKYKPLYLINPEIIALEDELVSREGCMSIPDYMANISRYNRVTLKWQNLVGEVLTDTFEGIEARCIQHEVDHLAGRLFLDRVACLKTDMLPRSKKR